MSAQLEEVASFYMLHAQQLLPDHGNRYFHLALGRCVRPGSNRLAMGHGFAAQAETGALDCLRFAIYERGFGTGQRCRRGAAGDPDSRSG